MEMGSKLRKLRRERDMTQDELADVLGVSFQAVSKWERGDSYPDISMLPGIASFFNISIDELLGMDELRRAEKIKEIQLTAAKRFSEGTHRDMAAVYREALKLFPNEDSLLRELANCLLGYRKGDAGVTPDEAREALDALNRILKYSDDDFNKSYARDEIPTAYFLAGEEERAVEEAKRLPTFLHTREFTMIHVTRGEKQIKSIQELLHVLMFSFWQITRFVAPPDTFVMDTGGDYFSYTPRERIEILHKGIKALELIPDEGDYPYMPVRISFNYRNMAELALSEMEYDLALDFIEKAANYAEINDTLPEPQSYTSVLRNRVEPQAQGKEQSHCCHNLLLYLEKDCFGPLRHKERFQSIVRRLLKHSPEYEEPQN